MINKSLFTLLLALLCTFSVKAAKEHLTRADSLFSAGKYVEALGIYEHILVKARNYSPQMLLKMAFVEESQENYPQALYYLNLYYRINPDKQVLKKLEEMATTYKLEGYQFTDKTYFFSLYDAYRWYIIAFLGVIALLMALWLISRVRQKRQFTTPLVMGLSVVCVIFLLHNLVRQGTKGIIKNDYTVLASKPSAAAKVIQVIPKGNRYTIIDKEDSWYRVELGEEEGFIRPHNTLVVQ